MQVTTEGDVQPPKLMASRGVGVPSRPVAVLRGWQRDCGELVDDKVTYVPSELLKLFLRLVNPRLTL